MVVDAIEPEPKTFDWDILNLVRLIYLEFYNKRRASII